MLGLLVTLAMGAPRWGHDGLIDTGTRFVGRGVIVRPARVLMKSAMRPSEWVHGWLGFDSMGVADRNDRIG